MDHGAAMRTHQSGFMGTPPAGGRADVQPIDAVRFVDDGPMPQHRGPHVLATMQQLGVVPGSGSE
jgi:hypothetical protein